MSGKLVPFDVKLQRLVFLLVRWPRLLLRRSTFTFSKYDTQQESQIFDRIEQILDRLEISVSSVSSSPVNGVLCRHVRRERNVRATTSEVDICIRTFRTSNTPAATSAGCLNGSVLPGGERHEDSLTVGLHVRTLSSFFPMVLARSLGTGPLEPVE